MTPYYSEAGITIYHGTCLDVLQTFPKTFVDLIVTDPPYGMGRFETDTKDYLQIVGPSLKEAWRCLRDTGSAFVFTSTGEVVRVANALGEPLKRLLWMYKPADMTYPLAGWLLKSEAILWFLKGDSIGLKERNGKYRHDTYVCTQIGHEGVEGHPTVKPLMVISDLVSRCPEDGLVLDPFMGSGTTLRAAKDLGRQAIGIEISEAYCEIAARRLQQEVLPLEVNPIEKRECDAEPSMFRGMTPMTNGE